MTGARPDQFAPVAIVSRSGVDESIHYGAVVCISPSGDIVHSIGDPATQIYPRSSTKPIQAVAMVRKGLSLPPELLAIVCASHNGEKVHLDAVRSVLRGAGLDEAALLNTASHQLDPDEARESIRHDVPMSSLLMNCSGKHSGMLATCVLNGWDTSNYLDLDHPLQQAITATLPTLAGEEAAAIGIDGCGAPAHVMSLLGLARTAQTIATSTDPACAAVFEAMSKHSYLVGGRNRDVTIVVSAVDGLFAKDGAESVYMAAMSDGRALAMKVADGGGRAQKTVFLAALAKLGIDVAQVTEQLKERVLGHGRAVGEVRAIG